jgi:hypothetical protein
MQPARRIEGRAYNNGNICVTASFVYWAFKLLGIHMNIEYIRLPDNKGSDIEGLQRLYVTVV